jgi:phage baseplate assembly protein W
MDDLKNIGTDEGKYYGTHNDITYENGDFVMVSGATRLKQNIAKILLSKPGDNQVFQGFGSQLSELISNEQVNDPNLRKNIVNAIVYSFTYLNEIDPTTELSEKIDSIQKIDIAGSKADPRQILIRVQCTNQLGETLTIALGG